MDFNSTLFLLTDFRADETNNNNIIVIIDPNMLDSQCSRRYYLHKGIRDE